MTQNENGTSYDNLPIKNKDQKTMSNIKKILVKLKKVVGQNCVYIVITTALKICGGSLQRI